MKRQIKIINEYLLEGNEKILKRIQLFRTDGQIDQEFILDYNVVEKQISYTYYSDEKFPLISEKLYSKHVVSESSNYTIHYGYNAKGRLVYRSLINNVSGEKKVLSPIAELVDQVKAKHNHLDGGQITLTTKKNTFSEEKIFRRFNRNGLIEWEKTTEIDYEGIESDTVKINYKYHFDSENNWIQKKHFNKGEVILTEHRDIIYSVGSISSDLLLWYEEIGKSASNEKKEENARNRQKPQKKEETLGELIKIIATKKKKTISIPIDKAEKDKDDFSGLL